MRKDCPRDIICHSCLNEGHTQPVCPVQLYGDYANDILEGKEADAIGTSSKSVSTNNNNNNTCAEASSAEKEKPQSDAKTMKKKKIHLILGDSNAARLYVPDDDVKCISSKTRGFL